MEASLNKGNINMDDTQYIFALFRLSILILCCVIAGLCIFLGSKIFSTSIASQSQADISAMGLKLVIKSSGPGLFLIGFGAFIISLVVSTQLKIEDSIGLQSDKIGCQNQKSTNANIEEKNKDIELALDQKKSLELPKGTPAKSTTSQLPLTNLNKNVQNLGDPTPELNQSVEKCSACIIRKRNISFSTGNDPLSKENILQTLTQSKDFLSNPATLSDLSILERTALVNSLESIIEEVRHDEN